MPGLSRFFGIIIRMFVEVGGPHHRPHAGKLPRRQRRLVKAWAELEFDDGTVQTIDFEPVLAGELCPSASRRLWRRLPTLARQVAGREIDSDSARDVGRELVRPGQACGCLPPVEELLHATRFRQPGQAAAGAHFSLTCRLAVRGPAASRRIGCRRAPQDGDTAGSMVR